MYRRKFLSTKFCVFLLIGNKRSGRRFDDLRSFEEKKYSGSFIKKIREDHSIITQYLYGSLFRTDTHHETVHSVIVLSDSSPGVMLLTAGLATGVSPQATSTGAGEGGFTLRRAE